MSVDQEGNVGVGTTSPGYKPDVTGDIRATGTIHGTVSNADNADGLDGYHAGNSSGQVAVSNGTARVSLNADMLDGANGSKYLFDMGSSNRGFRGGRKQCSGGGTSVVFNSSFGGIPVVVATPEQAGVIATVTNTGRNSFMIVPKNHYGTTFTGAANVDWIAIGAR